jgi:serine/threonine protein kinase
MKPENILLCGMGYSSAMIADYGLAARIFVDSKGHKLLLTDRCGTSYYAAPECMQRSPYDTQADMWSIGVIFYCVLAGYLPFNDKSKAILREKICKADHTFDKDNWRGISRTAKDSFRHYCTWIHRFI